MPELDPETISKAKEVVYETFAGMAGVEPAVSTREVCGKDGESVQTLYVLAFRQSVSLPDGGSLVRAVRVTMDQGGEIVKLASSR